MAEKKVGVKYEVDASQLGKAAKVQARYNKLLGIFRSRLAASTRGAKLLEGAIQKAIDSQRRGAQAAQEQSEVYHESTGELLKRIRAQEEASQKTEENSQKTDDNTKKKKENAQAQKEAVAATNKSSRAWAKNVRTLAFWAIGAASVFRLVQKLRRELIETIGTITKNTEEANRLKEAQNNLKVSFVGVIGDGEKWSGILGRIADGVDIVTNAVKVSAAAWKGLQASQNVIINDMIVGVTRLVQVMNSMTRLDAAEALRLTADGMDQMGTKTDAAQAYLDAYAESLAQSARAEDEFRRASEKTDELRETQKDRVKELEDAQKSLFDLQQALADAQKARLEALADLETERLRRLQDINEETQRALADVALKGARKREDIEIAYRRRMEDLEDKKAEALTRIAERLALKLLRIEMRYREKMIRIGENFDDAIFGAILKRDATAALMAIRRKARDEGRAQRERSNAITIANAEAAIQRAQAVRAQEERRENAALIRQRALEDLARDQARRRQDILKNHERELADLGLFLQRSKDDIELAYQRRIAKARERYAQEEKEYRAHLNKQYVALRGHITRMNALGGVQAPTTKKDKYTAAAAVGFAQGGDMTFKRPTTIRVAERGPERVIAQPVRPGSGGTFSGSMQHQISGSIDAAMAGFEGRLGAAITDTVIEVMGDMLQ